ncbi:putative holin-like toxin [Ammoniphilus resinae]|uniref:Holin-like toxin n=1 Tax=Ammoniphilus resinae TaxID=861532 RepID=A0ABS4GPH9_9BACL|nr:hypothetical protein [Ammoniphilus resinae]
MSVYEGISLMISFGSLVAMITLAIANNNRDKRK